jgi:hypothetical protein
VAGGGQRHGARRERERGERELLGDARGERAIAAEPFERPVVE